MQNKKWFNNVMCKNQLNQLNIVLKPESLPNLILEGFQLKCFYGNYLIKVTFPLYSFVSLLMNVALII